MDRWKVCPECGSTNIHCDLGVNEKSDWAGQTNQIIVNTNARFKGRAPLDLFVCVDCGHVRMFVADMESLKKIEQKWPRADAFETSDDLNIRRVVSDRGMQTEEERG